MPEVRLGETSSLSQRRGQQGQSFSGLYEVIVVDSDAKLAIFSIPIHSASGRVQRDTVGLPGVARYRTDRTSRTGRTSRTDRTGRTGRTSRTCLNGPMTTGCGSAPPTASKLLPVIVISNTGNSDH